MEYRPVFILLGLLAGSGALADEAYTWTDEDGVVHYSDRPQPGARRVELFESSAPRPRGTTRDTTATTADRGEEAPEPTAPFSYQTLEVAVPAPEETLWNIEGVLDVTLALSPALRPGDQVRVYFDGTPRMVSGTVFQIQEVWRGVHNIQVEVIDPNGNLMIRSLPNRFYVQQNRVFRAR